MAYYEEATSFLGEKGPFFWRVFFLLSLMIVSSGFNQFYMLFVGGVPQHHCLVSETNLTKEWKEAIIPLEVVNGHEERSRCSRYRLDVVRNLSAQGLIPGRDVNLTGLEKEGCMEGWSYSTDIYHFTIVTEWDLVCENDWKVPLTISVLYAGNLFGALVSGALSDRFGRKKVLFFSTAATFILVLLQAFSPSYEFLCILLFASGSFMMSLGLSNFVLATEVLSKYMREVYSAFGGLALFFSFGYMILPWIAYGIREWRTLIIILSMLMLTYIPFWWLIPESPRWLISKGRVEEAEAIVRYIAKINKVEAPQVIFDKTKLDVEDQPTKRHNILDLLKTSNIRCITLVCLMSWIAVNMGYYGLSLNSTSLTGNPYLNSTLSAVVEVPAYLASIVLLRKCRRRPIILSLLVIGGGLLLMQLIPHSLQPLAIAIEMCGKIAFTISFCIVYIYTAELYPTVVRNSGIGLCSCVARIGVIIVPYVIFLGEYNKSLPYIIMGFVPLVTSLTIIFLPETFNKVLPQTMEQMQKAKGMCWKMDRKSYHTENKEIESTVIHATGC